MYFTQYVTNVRSGSDRKVIPPNQMTWVDVVKQYQIYRNIRQFFSNNLSEKREVTL